jgi:hypothetical protein
MFVLRLKKVMSSVLLVWGQIDCHKAPFFVLF